jgi:hypothetical protein
LESASGPKLKEEEEEEETKRTVQFVKVERVKQLFCLWKAKVETLDHFFET